MRTEAEFEVTVAARHEVADGVVALALAPVAGAAPAWEPGAHVDLLLGNGLVRQYSLCGDPADRRALTVAVLREPDGRGGSAFVHDTLRPGDRLRARGPRNHFPLVPAERYRFVAGGIGITPLLPMLRAATRDGIPWRLTYGGRTRRGMAYRQEVADLARSAASVDAVDIRPQDETGLLNLDAAIGAPQPGTLVYCCGPEPLLAAAEAHCAGWPPGSLHVERFAARPGAADPAPGSAADAEFTVECTVSGVSVTVPVGTSILEAVEAAGVEVLSSCREGTCGTCETVVLDGLPDHRDSVLDAQEHAANEVMMICCSRARSPRLVLQL